jgi:hypothetical protein
LGYILGHFSHKASGHPAFANPYIRSHSSKRELLPRVARWYTFKPNFPSWVNFGGSQNGICWYIWNIFAVIWNILRPFGNFSVIYWRNVRIPNDGIPNYGTSNKGMPNLKMPNNGMPNAECQMVRLGYVRCSKFYFFGIWHSVVRYSCINAEFGIPLFGIPTFGIPLFGIPSFGIWT